MCNLLHTVKMLKNMCNYMYDLKVYAHTVCNRTHAHECTNAHECMYTNAVKCTHARECTYVVVRPQMHARKRMRARTRAGTCKHARASTHAHARARTRTHAQTPANSPTRMRATCIAPRTAPQTPHRRHVACQHGRVNKIFFI